MFRLPRRCLRNLQIQSSKQFIRSFRVLGIETSCDDTCVAVLDIEESSAPVIRHNVVRRSLKLSEPYGGIVPNLVGMFHAKELGKALSEVRDEGGFKGLDLIAVTRGNNRGKCCLIGRTRDTNVFGRRIEPWYYSIKQKLTCSKRTISGT
jgi:hypothetical protein